MNCPLDLARRGRQADACRGLHGCEAVRLELNGKEIGTEPLAPDTKPTARFEVPYAPGELRAAA